MRCRDGFGDGEVAAKGAESAEVAAKRRVERWRRYSVHGVGLGPNGRENEREGFGGGRVEKEG